MTQRQRRTGDARQTEDLSASASTSRRLHPWNPDPLVPDNPRGIASVAAHRWELRKLREDKRHAHNDMHACLRGAGHWPSSLSASSHSGWGREGLGSSQPIRQSLRRHLTNGPSRHLKDTTPHQHGTSRTSNSCPLSQEGRPVSLNGFNHESALLVPVIAPGLMTGDANGSQSWHIYYMPRMGPEASKPHRLATSLPQPTLQVMNWRL